MPPKENSCLPPNNEDLRASEHQSFVGNSQIRQRLFLVNERLDGRMKQVCWKSQIPEDFPQGNQTMPQSVRSRLWMTVQAPGVK